MLNKREKDIHNLLEEILFPIVYLTLLLFILDAVTTWYALSHLYGIYENMAIALWFIENFGLRTAILAGTAIKITALVFAVAIFKIAAKKSFDCHWASSGISSRKNISKMEAKMLKILPLITIIAICVVALFNGIAIINNILRILGWI